MTFVDFLFHVIWVTRIRESSAMIFCLGAGNYILLGVGRFVDTKWQTIKVS